MMVAQVTGLKPYEFVHTFGDLHIYSNHIEGAKEQLSREPRALPKMTINPDVKDIFSLLEILFKESFLDLNILDTYGIH